MVLQIMRMRGKREFLNLKKKSIVIKQTLMNENLPEFIF